MEQPKPMMCRNKICINEGMMIMGQKYCAACGHKLENPPKCKHCATFVSPRINFCVECGRPNK